MFFSLLSLSFKDDGGCRWGTVWSDRITLSLFTLCFSLFLVLLWSHNVSVILQQWFFVNFLLVVSFESSSVGFMYLICCVYSLLICRCKYVLKSIMLLPSKVYDIQGNLQDGSQVVVSVIFENKCDSFLKSMEFNVLDSLNSKLQRPEGSGPHDGLTVPFQLPPGHCFSANAGCDESTKLINAELYTVVCF